MKHRIHVDDKATVRPPTAQPKASELELRPVSIASANKQPCETFQFDLNRPIRITRRPPIATGVLVYSRDRSCSLSVCSLHALI